VQVFILCITGNLNQTTGSFKMKKIIALILAGMFLVLSCANQKNLSEEEKEKYRNARQRYDAGQRGGR
jgi:hypothetical protein